MAFMSETTLKVIVAIICITVLEVTALLVGFNGSLLRFVLVVIAGLCGFTVGKKTNGGG